MNKTFLAAAYLTLAAMFGNSYVKAADTVTDAAQVKLQAASMAQIKTLLQAAGAYNPNDIELSSAAHQMTITIIDSGLNNRGSAEREAEATKMVSGVAIVIADKPEFSKLPVIHVDYVKRQGSKLTAVQRIDFFQSPAGVFVLHKT